MSDTFTIISAMIIGAFLGSLITSIIISGRNSRRGELQMQFLDEGAQMMRDTFGNLSRQALAENQQMFFQTARSQFEALVHRQEASLNEKETNIDRSLKQMNGRLDSLSRTTAELGGQLKDSYRQVSTLSDTTARLREVLSSSQHRGRWGERMVEDILGLMGLLEGVNYERQSSTETGRPDFTFHLPHKRHINMDVKFPLEHYENCLTAGDERLKKQHKDLFLKAVREHLRAVEKRDYVNVAAGTVDYVLVFIPNESIYYFINEQDKGLIDYALARRIILCSPVTLYAVLSLVRQSVASFAIEQKAGDVQKLVAAFKKQWLMFTERMDRLGNQINTVQKSFIELSTTRSRALERPLDQIVDLQLEETAAPLEV